MNVAVLGNGQLAGALRDVLAPYHILTDVPRALVTWCAYDIEVAPDGHANLESVRQPLRERFDDLADHSIVLVSSQVPPGFTMGMRREFHKARPEPRVDWAYLVENIKANSGANGWLAQREFVAGVHQESNGYVISQVLRLLAPFNKPVRFMGTTSAELVKLAINGLLATVIGFVNEVGDMATALGANPDDVEIGLRADSRLHACPVRPGQPFDNGHLGRDLCYLMNLGDSRDVYTPVLRSVYTSNRNRLAASVGTAQPQAGTQPAEVTTCDAL